MVAKIKTVAFSGIETIPINAEANIFFDAALEKLNLSARGYYRVLKAARTIADLDGGDALISKNHIAEALSLRPRSYLNT